MAAQPAKDEPPVPVLLLKTRSTPGDSYHDHLTAAQLPHGRRAAPIFVPVMRHRFDDAGLATLRDLLLARQISSCPGASYGGLIFTSQRAVEAFAHVVCAEKPRQAPAWPHLDDVPVYSVGPATTRALRAVPAPLQVSGEHTGNGEALAQHVLAHYGARYRDWPTKPPLLFLVGEQRRDVIPRTLMDPALPADRRIEVTEEVTAADVRHAPEGLPERWVVVFSPTGCDSMLRALGMLDDAGWAVPSRRDGKTLIATIGPTTRDFLVNTFGFYPDVCAAEPSPKGVLEGIADFEARIAAT